MTNKNSFFHRHINCERIFYVSNHFLEIPYFFSSFSAINKEIKIQPPKNEFIFFAEFIKNQTTPVTSLFFAGYYSLSSSTQFLILVYLKKKTQNLSFRFLDLLIKL